MATMLQQSTPRSLLLVDEFVSVCSAQGGWLWYTTTNPALMLCFAACFCDWLGQGNFAIRCVWGGDRVSRTQF